ncbi:MAG: signal peptidase II [Candidatus Dadabacteria bacterium]|nr:signal peptidase II [Candidatus Dadabacteria bacterium]MCY4046960.1 signal peptidase II [Candidatus Dadabacteria bacterium]
MAVLRGRFLVATVSAACVDLAVKSAVITAVATGARHEVLPFVDIVRHTNAGIAFGLFQELGDFPRLFLHVSALVLAGVFAVLFLRRGANALAVGLVTGGAIGNSVERLVFGGVTDFVSVHWFGSESLRWPAFNMADVFITVGAAALVVDLLTARCSRG